MGLASGRVRSPSIKWGADVWDVAWIHANALKIEELEGVPLK